jgi:hypothetical protein
MAEYSNTDMVEEITKKIFVTKPEIPIYTNVVDIMRDEFERNETRNKKHNLFLMKKRRRTYDRYHKAH